MSELSDSPAAELITVLRDRSEATEQRVAAANRLGEMRCRNAVKALIETLEEGDSDLLWYCSQALATIGSRRHCRMLIRLLRKDYPVTVR